jgi:GT2 family glycosyltransferase
MYEIIVVDNHSNDGTVRWLQKQVDIVLINNAYNVGFPAACNQGIKVAAGDAILLVNNHVVVTTKWLSNLVRALYSNEQVGAVGPLTNAGSYYSAICPSYETMEDLHRFAQYYNQSNKEQWDERLKLTSFCLLMKKDIVQQIGELDTLFPLRNVTEDDVSLRIRQAGYTLLLCKDTYVHHGGSTVPRTDLLELFRVNEQQFMGKWGVTKNDLLIDFELIGLLPTLPFNSKVLHVNCQCGATLVEIKNKFRHHHLTLYGVEKKEGPASIARTVAHIETSLHAYESNMFDVIIVTNIEESLQELLPCMRRLLKGNGILLLSIHNANYYMVAESLHRTQRIDPINPHYYTLEEIHDDLSNHLFRLDTYSSLQNPHVDQTSTEFQEVKKSNVDTNYRHIIRADLPLVSILIPTYNRPFFLQEALKSAINQTYSHIEIVISDDSTDDETEKIIREQYVPHYPFIRYIKQKETLGGFKNNLFLFQEAKGEFINYLMDDDLFEETKIEKMMKVFLADKGEEIKLVTSHRQYFVGDGDHRMKMSMVKKQYEKDTVIDGITLGNYILMENHNVLGEPTTVLFRKKDLREPFGVYEGREYGCNVDKATWLQLLQQGKAVYLTDTLSYFRFHANQQSSNPHILFKGLEDYAHEVMASYRNGFLQEEGQYEVALSGVLRYGAYIKAEKEMVDQEAYEKVINIVQAEYDQINSSITKDKG